MSLIGTYFTLWVGPMVPVPAAPQLLEALESVEVTLADEGRSGFRITFRAGRSESDILDYGLLTNPQLRPFSRVLMIVTFNAIPQVLMDGIITRQELNPSEQPGASTLTVIGEDVSVMMDLEEKSVEHPAQDETIIALKIIATYAQYGLIPTVIPPVALDFPIPIERTPVQQGTDLEYLQTMAQRHGYMFYVTPGPAPLTNTAYWGPPVRVGIPQKAISVNMGPSSNVAGDMNFSYNGLAPTQVSGQVQDRQLGQTVPVETFASTRIPLSSQPAWLTQSHQRRRQFRQSGLNTMQAYGRAQAEMDASNDQVLTATGQLDAMRYEALLKPRGLVGLRGAGFNYDGFYYVQSVTHNLRVRENAYSQSFTLTREGTGAISPVVIP
jgi:hypothetical protein